MSAERHQRVKELFLDACERDAGQRRAWLAAACGADESLRAEVEEMLGVDAEEGGVLERPAWSAPHGASGARLSAAELERLAARAAARSYEVAEELGRGGMGSVLRARDVDLRRDLAMKVRLDAPGPGSSAGDASARFLEEARTTARLDHPGIVPVHDLGLDGEGRLYFTMKLVEGRDLSEILRLRGEQGWSLTRIAGVLQKVCEAVAYAHSKGVVHRDLKPANVRVGEYGEVYVMDWGIARDLRSREARQEGAPPGEGPEPEAGLTRAGSILGTPYGMAPEQARGEPAGPLADVYAVGAMLYEALAGRRPYQPARGGAHAAAVIAAILRGPPEPLRALAPAAPAELVAIAERAMAPRPEDRYADMRALAEDLRAYLEGRVVRAHRTGALAELRKWVARNRLAASGVGAAMLAVVAGLAWSREIEARGSRELDLAADYFRARVVRDTAGDLWPAEPAMAPALADWIGRAERLLDRRSLHRARLSALEAAGGADPTEIGRQRALLEHLDELDGEAGILAQVRARHAFATTVEERTLRAPGVAATWRRVRASILAGDTHAAYAGLDLPPQLGLVPLGPDPLSGLHEFVHLQSGEAPARDAAGKLVLAAESGIVLVLLPGGAFPMGGGDQEGAPAFDPEATSGERPVREVTLAPFFLGKHEITQAQWERITGANPSRWKPGHRDVVTSMNPVEQVSWIEAEDLLRKLGLVLPTEARWEYACRAGTDTPFACAREDLGRFANVADKSFGDAFRPRPGDEAFDDGFAFHAPIGSLAPNALGLHDTHGNVLEWVLDAYGSYTHPRDPRDGGTLGPEPGGPASWWSPDLRVSRGGNYELPGTMARSSRRMAMHPTFVNHALGVRAAREILPAQAP